MASIPAYKEFVELIASLNPERILKFNITDETLTRVQELVTKNNAGQLTAEEDSELKYFLYLENLLGLARARARQIAANSQR